MTTQRARQLLGLQIETDEEVQEIILRSKHFCRGMLKVILTEKESLDHIESMEGGK